MTAQDAGPVVKRVEMDYPATLRHLRALVAAEGARAGIAFLNSLTEHRFTALYRFDRDALRSVVFFDRENPATETTETIPVLSSYCVFVRDSGASFRTDHASADERIGNHVKRHVVQAYCGVPLRDMDGNLFGTICHFDYRPMSISPANVELMEAIATTLKDAA